MLEAETEAEAKILARMGSYNWFEAASSSYSYTVWLL